MEYIRYQLHKYPSLALIVRLVFLTFLFSTTFYNAFSQTAILKGIIRDEKTSKPIQDVNIKVFGTTRGTSTDKTGIFSLAFDKLPAELIFTCLGYETSTYDINKIPGKTMEFLLRPKSYTLPEVNISSKNYSFLFKDNDYSVLDYELLDDNILLLIYRYQLNQSELVLISRKGDTLAISGLPEMPPARLFKDFLSDVHYFSKSDNSYQCYYNEPYGRIDFFPKATVDKLKSFVSPFIFKIDNRLYFQEQVAGGFGTAFGYYEKGSGKKYIRKFVNDKKIAETFDDLSFYQTWNTLVGNPNILAPDDPESDQAFDFSASRTEADAYGKNEARAVKMEFYKMIFPVIKTSDNNIAFFNFAMDSIELMDQSGKISKTVPITFHKEKNIKTDTLNAINLSNSEWRWGSTIMTDEQSRDIYTIFLKNGMVKIQGVDLETGKLKNATILPFIFPEKIIIDKGDAFFLVKVEGPNDKWKLVKCKLQ